MSDETLIGRAVRRARQDYEGDERRQKPPTDWLKFLPLALVVASGYGAYTVQSYRVERLEQDFREYKADHKDAHRAIWQRLGGNPEAKQ